MLLLANNNSFCQDKKDIEHQLWVMANLNWKLNAKWTYNQDFSYQHLYEEPTITRFLTRSQFNRQLTPAFSLHGGMFFFYNLKEEDDNSIELRPWVGAKLRWPSFWRLDFEHYVRFEQRFEHTNGIDDWENGFRIRYKIGTNIPINHPSVTDKTIYGVVAYEFFGIPFNQEVRFTAEATHRFDLGIGYRPNVKNRYEAVAVAFDSPDDITGKYTVANFALFLKYKRYFNWK